MTTTKLERVVRDGRTWILVPNTLYGDYTGTTVERSNSLVLLNKYKHEECNCNAWIENEYYVGNGIYEKPTFDPDTQLVEVVYSYSTSELYALESNEELKEIIASLEDYPVIDEDNLSMLEWEMREAYIEEEIVEYISRKYFEEAEAYCKKYDCTDTELKDDIREAALEYIDDNNMYFIFEQAYCAYLRDTDEVIKAVVETLFTE